MEDDGVVANDNHYSHDGDVAEAATTVVCSVFFVSLVDDKIFVRLFGVDFAAVAPRDCSNFAPFFFLTRLTAPTTTTTTTFVVRCRHLDHNHRLDCVTATAVATTAAIAATPTNIPLFDRHRQPLFSMAFIVATPTNISTFDRHR